jgi:lysophospholipase L1-like esterase
MNKQLAKLDEKEAKVSFIDLAPAFLDDSGEFQPDLFVWDGTHFSPRGYEIVTELLRDQF